MVSKQFSFRLADEVVEALERLQLEGESLNQTAQRILTKSVGLSTSTSNHLSTPVDIEEFKREVEASFSEVRSQLEELRGKSIAR